MKNFLNIFKSVLASLTLYLMRKSCGLQRIASQQYAHLNRCPRGHNMYSSAAVICEDLLVEFSFWK